MPPDALPSLHAIQRAVNDGVGDDLGKLPPCVKAWDFRVP